MKEKDLNHILNKSFKQVGFSHKIADPLGGSGIQNPFDGFSVFHNHSWYWESKLLKGYQSFNFKKIEDHQRDNLLLINSILKDHTYCLVIVGVHEPRKYFDIFLFDIITIQNAINKDKKSFLKKELLNFKERGKFVTIQRIDGSYTITPNQMCYIEYKII